MLPSTATRPIERRIHARTWSRGLRYEHLAKRRNIGAIEPRPTRPMTGHHEPPPRPRARQRYGSVVGLPRSSAMSSPPNPILHLADWSDTIPGWRCPHGCVPWGGKHAGGARDPTDVTRSTVGARTATDDVRRAVARLPMPSTVDGRRIVERIAGHGSSVLHQRRARALLPARRSQRSWPHDQPLDPGSMPRELPLHAIRGIACSHHWSSQSL